MLLTDTEKGILREIYEVPPVGDIVIAGENVGYPTGIPLPIGGIDTPQPEGVRIPDSARQLTK